MSFKRRQAKPAVKGPSSENILRQVREAALQKDWRAARRSVWRAVPGGRIACAAAFALAEKLKISKAQIGKALDELEIKIERCQLGCF
jgi:hypothetical protein